MGSSDRLFRVIIAVGILVLYMTNVISGTLGITLVIISIVFLLTSFVSFCPLYRVFGINTMKKKNA